MFVSILNASKLRLPRASPLLLALTLLPSATCHAARPLSTDDAGVQAVGDCESDSYAGRSMGRQHPSANAAVTQLGCGVFGQTYLGVAYAHTLEATDIEQTLALVGKTALQEGTEEVAGYAVSWGTVGRKVRGTAFRYDGWYATLVRTASLPGGWTGHANLGATYQHDSHALTARWSLALEHALVGSVRAGVETFADNHDRAPWVQAGVSADIPFKGLSLNTSFGTQLSAARNRLATAGATFDF